MIKDIDKMDILSLNMERLKDFITALGEKEYRAGQIFSWLHKKNVTDFNQMTDIPQSLKDKLNEAALIQCCQIAEKHTSKIDETVKYLYGVSEGFIESVVMRYDYGNTICISSQVGCAMGCTFCASAEGGLVRNLTAGEMLSELYVAESDLGIEISNVVIMGTGEPLNNYDNVTLFLELANDKRGKNLSMRNITLSTCGLVPKIIELAGKSLKINLAISLHAADDELRRKLMPNAAVYTIKELVEAADIYFLKTGRRVTWEYMLIDGVNDTYKDAFRLAALLKKKNTHVNIISVNKIRENGFSQSGNISRFMDILLKNGINVTRRKSLGCDINGACGQLRSRRLS